MATAAIYGVVTVYMKQQQVVTGTALNILAAGICAYFQRVLFGVPTTPLQIDTLPKVAIPILSQIPYIGPIFFCQNILTYLAYVLIPLAGFVLFKTSLGLTLRSTGENPEAVDVAGINVNRIRFFTVLVAGAISGLAGSFYTVGYLGMEILLPIVVGILLLSTTSWLEPLLFLISIGVAVLVNMSFESQSSAAFSASSVCVGSRGSKPPNVLAEVLFR